MRPPMTPEDRRRERLLTLDEQIAQSLHDSAASGELRSAPSWGRPLAEDAGCEATPDALRLPYKILKNAGLAPPEVLVMQEIRQLQQALQACTGDDEPAQAARLALQQRLSERRQHLALRLERLRLTGSL